jgi:hypothetical protein
VSRESVEAARVAAGVAGAATGLAASAAVRWAAVAVEGTGETATTASSHGPANTRTRFEGVI